MLATPAKFHPIRTYENIVIVEAEANIDKISSISNHIIKELEKSKLKPTGVFAFSFKESKDETLKIEYYFEVKDGAISNKTRYTSYLQFCDFISCYIYQDFSVSIEIGMKKILRQALELGMQLVSFPYIIGDIKHPERLELLMMFNVYKLIK